MNFRTWVNFTPDQICGEVNSLPSLTVPGHTLPLRQLVERYVRGQDVQQFTPQYTDDDAIPVNIERMTEIEKTDLARDLSVALDRQRQRIRAADVRAQAKDIMDDTEPSDLPAYIK